MSAYKLKYDLHTHTTYSHGSGSILDNATIADAKGMHMLGIADHGPGHIFYGIKMSDVAKMRSDINEAKSLFPKLDIELSVEANIVNRSGALDLSKEDQKLFDYVIAGYHKGYFGEEPVRGFKVFLGSKINSFSDKTYNTDLVVKALYENDIKVLTHPGDKIEVDINEISKACAERGTLLEINNHHNGLSMTDIAIAAQYNVYFVISSDAHSPKDVGCFDVALKRAEAVGLALERIINLWN